MAVPGGNKASNWFSPSRVAGRLSSCRILPSQSCTEAQAEVDAISRPQVGFGIGADGFIVRWIAPPGFMATSRSTISPAMKAGAFLIECHQSSPLALNDTVRLHGRLRRDIRQTGSKVVLSAPTSLASDSSRTEGSLP